MHQNQGHRQFLDYGSTGRGEKSKKKGWNGRKGVRTEEKVLCTSKFLDIAQRRCQNVILPTGYERMKRL